MEICHFIRRSKIKIYEKIIFSKDYIIDRLATLLESNKTPDEALMKIKAEATHYNQAPDWIESLDYFVTIYGCTPAVYQKNYKEDLEWARSHGYLTNKVEKDPEKNLGLTKLERDKLGLT